MYCNCLVTRLWRHGFWNKPYLSNQAVFSTWSKSHDKNLNVLRTKRAFKVKFKAFRSKASINLFTVSARMEQNILASFAVPFLIVFFSITSTTSITYTQVKTDFQYDLVQNTFLVSFLLFLFHINKRNWVYSFASKEFFWFITWVTQIENKLRSPF